MRVQEAQIDDAHLGDGSNAQIDKLIVKEQHLRSLLEKLLEADEREVALRAQEEAQRAATAANEQAEVSCSQMLHC